MRLPLLLALAFVFGCLEDKASPASPPVVLPAPSGAAAAKAVAKAPAPKIVACPNAATGGTFVSCGGQVYKTVKIGKQVWMAENLNYDVPSTATDVCYEYKKENCAKYGRLYNWATAMALPPKCNGVSPEEDADCAVKIPNHQGICPNGWHIPRDAEWNVLMIFHNNDDIKLKAKSGWNNYEYDPCECRDVCGECNKKKETRSGNGTDNYGFAALPGGCGFMFDKLNFSHIGYTGLWWLTNTNQGYIRGDPTGEGEPDYYGWKTSLFSIRCLKD